MVTKFSAADARQAVELAKQQADFTRQKLESEIRQTQKVNSAIRAGWTRQRKKIIESAVKGLKEIVVEKCVFQYKRLIELDFEVVEIGQVQKRITAEQRQKNIQDWEDLPEKLSRRVDRLLVQFIRDFKKELLPYYRSLDHLQSSLQEALSAAKDSRNPLFKGDDIIWDRNFPRSSIEKFVPKFKEITQTIKLYRRAREDVACNPFGLEEKPDEFQGEYIFDNNDTNFEKLVASKNSNSLAIRWGSNPLNGHLNSPIFSRKGVAWIASVAGQNFISAVFKSIEVASFKGATDVVLNFRQSEYGWFFVGGDEYCSCTPDQLSGVVQVEGYKISAIEFDNDCCRVKLAW